MEWSDWCYWDVSVVTSLLQFVLHELHPDDIVFKVIHGEYTIKVSTCFQLIPNVKFQLIIVVYTWTEAGNEHYSHIVIDIVKGTYEIMDPHADAQTVEVKWQHLHPNSTNQTIPFANAEDQLDIACGTDSWIYLEGLYNI